MSFFGRSRNKTEPWSFWRIQRNNMDSSRLQIDISLDNTWPHLFRQAYRDLTSEYIKIHIVGDITICVAESLNPRRD